MLDPLAYSLHYICVANVLAVQTSNFNYMVLVIEWIQ